MFKNYFKFLLGLLRDSVGVTLALTGIAEVDAAIPEFWAEGILEDGKRKSFWNKFTGKEGSKMPVIDKTGPLKAKGDQLTFNTIEGLYGSGVTGESTLQGNEEQLAVGSFTVTVDMVRHAVGVTKKSTLQANFDQVQFAGRALKDWIGRKMDNDIFSAILAVSGETIYANDKTSTAALNETDGDVFGINEIEMIRMALLRKGATPIGVSRENGEEIPIFGIVMGEIEEYSLSLNTTFVHALREARERGPKNPLFTASLGMYRGMLLYNYSSIIPGLQGTALRPEAAVYATLTTTATVLSVGGATRTTGVTPNYTLFFASSGSLQVEDEIISYTSKGTNSFIDLTRGVSSTTAAQHIPDKLVTQRNIGKVIGFGGEAVFRAIGEQPTPIGQKFDYGAEIGIGIEAYYGQALKKDKYRGGYPNIVICECFSKNPGTI